MHSTVQLLSLFCMCYEKLQKATFNLWNLSVPFRFFNSFIIVSCLKDLVTIDSEQDIALVLLGWFWKWDSGFFNPKHFPNSSQYQMHIWLATSIQKQLLCLPEDKIPSQSCHLPIVSEKDIFLNWGMFFADRNIYVLLSVGGVTVCVREGISSNSLNPLRVGWNILQ